MVQTPWQVLRGLWLRHLLRQLDKRLDKLREEREGLPARRQDTIVSLNAECTREILRLNQDLAQKLAQAELYYDILGPSLSMAEFKATALREEVVGELQKLELQQLERAAK